MFNVTYEIITPESAAEGDVAETGFIAKGLDLRSAIDFLFETRASLCGGVEAIEANEWPIYAPRWISVYNGMEFETGACENRSLHLPDHITPASRRRIYRLLTK